MLTFIFAIAVFIFMALIGLGLVSFSLSIFAFVFEKYVLVLLSFFIFLYRIITFPQAQPESSEDGSHHNSKILLDAYSGIDSLLKRGEVNEAINVVERDFHSRLEPQYASKEFLDSTFARARTLGIASLKYAKAYFYTTIYLKRLILFLVFVLPFVIAYFACYFYANYEYKTKTFERTQSVFVKNTKGVWEGLKKYGIEIKQDSIFLYDKSVQLFTKDTKSFSKTCGALWDIFFDGVVDFALHAFLLALTIAINPVSLVIIIMWLCYFVLYRLINAFNLGTKRFVYRLYNRGRIDAGDNLLRMPDGTLP
ncbi:hypothetical protein LS71_002560 [Helicobacter jaachi]|uniref:Uncharacterized protein n=1 Tax=Helicobacter jaachi TaxID=1677920 RepID=A0A4U8TDA5_9HELI|nr:hypothetical protein [Helicobacter jaachi]TLD97644.1 hypothetical protein LS71_002560 [Helicobacter jaachi]